MNVYNWGSVGKEIDALHTTRTKTAHQRVSTQASAFLNSREMNISKTNKVNYSIAVREEERNSI
jgi:hypothetical protein